MIKTCCKMDQVIQYFSQGSSLARVEPEFIEFDFDDYIKMKRLAERLPPHLLCQMTIAITSLRIPAQLIPYIHAVLFATVSGVQLLSNLPESDYEITQEDFEIVSN